MFDTMSTESEQSAHFDKKISEELSGESPIQVVGSDQLQLIAALRVAEERSALLAALVGSSDDAIISKDLDGIVLTWNHAAERIFGYTAEEIVGSSISKLIPVEKQNEENEIFSRIKTGERVAHYQTQRITKDQRIIDVSLTISPIRETSGRITGISKIVRDITQQVIIEKKSAILTAIVASTDDAIISKDFNSIITSWNNSAERIFGYSENEMIGESILKLIPPDRQKEEPEIISKLKRGERVDHFETKRLTKFGKQIDVSLTISPVLDANGHIIGVSKIARDITDKKREEQRKNDFIAIISHELNTPLTAVRSYVQLALARSVEGHDIFTENMLRRAEKQTSKMTAMIRDFLSLSRLEESRMTLNYSNFSLPQLVEEVVNEVTVMSPAHVLNYKCSLDAIVNADRDKLSLVVTNLLSNAIKYSPEGTTVQVRCETTNELATITVSDMGVGISKADQVRLFERFYRVDEDHHQNVSGFGIGLYLVAEILKLHGSKIHVQSDVGKGSIFSFSLPYK